jgi:23S rRNA pseudouridine2604 synthase
MNIKLDIPVGEFRELTKEELKELNVLIEDSTKTYSESLTRPRNHKN